MFFAHLSTFFVLIAFLLFWIRFKNLRPSEILLGIFSGIYLITTSAFLAYQYYNFKAVQLLDLLGVISELFTLFIPIFYIYFLNKSDSIFRIIIKLLFFVSAITILHFLLSDHSGFLFYGTNKNAKWNLIFQIGIDFILFFVFTYAFVNYRKDNQELFDGDFKWTIGIIFIGYYVQDIVTLIVITFLTNYKDLNDSIFVFGNIMNVTVSYLLIHLAIYTNWLSIWHIIKNPNNKSNKENVKSLLLNKNATFSSVNITTQILIEDLRKLDLVDYKSVKVHFSQEFESLFNEIDALEDYSKTEKLYYFLDKMDFSHKELSDILNVSVRTVETNFYRLRKKIQKQPL